MLKHGRKILKHIFKRVGILQLYRDAKNIVKNLKVGISEMMFTGRSISLVEMFIKVLIFFIVCAQPFLV